LREIDLPVLKGISITAAHEERELTAIGLEEAAEVEPIALRFVVGDEARCGRGVEMAIVAVQRAMELADRSLQTAAMLMRSPVVETLVLSMLGATCSSRFAAA
jgi:hypothetical protein